MIGTYKYRTKVFEAGYKTLAYDQCLALTEIRVDDPERENISLQVFRGVAGCMDKASRRFFRRVKKKEKEGFSRFRRNASWCAIEENLVRLEFRENREEAR